MWKLFNKKNKTDGEHRTLQLITDKKMPFGYVEAYKSLRTNLDFMAGSMDVHTLVITSTVPEESKSNVAVNLALTLAESGKKVALVDCDLRKPVLHRYLKAGHNVKGVSNVLSNQCTLDETLQELKEMNLTFLPAGTPPPNPSEMLSQPQMQAMVNTLREKFDVVIFDAPPVSVVTDAAVIGRYVDGAMFVVRSDYAPADAVRGAVKKLQDAGVRVLGSVLTRYDMKKALKGSSYAYSYAYNYNYAYENQKADVAEYGSIVMTDLHCHILPGIDDGAKDTAVSLELLRREYEDGVRNIAFTSHFNSERTTVEAFTAKRQAAFEQLTAALEGQPMQFDFKLGAEVFFSPGLCELDTRALCMGDTAYLLLEFPTTHKPHFIRQTLYQLQQQGIVPLIAHIERYPYVLEDPTLLYDWVAAGAYAQINAGALLEPKLCKKLCKFIQWGLVHVISTDTHSPDKRPPRMAQGVQQLEKLLGKETAARIVRNGDELFHDQELDAATLHQPKKFLGMWV